MGFPINRHQAGISKLGNEGKQVDLKLRWLDVVFIKQDVVDGKQVFLFLQELPNA